MKQIKGQDQSSSGFVERVKDKMDETRFIFVCINQVIVTMKSLRNEQKIKPLKQIYEVSPETPIDLIDDLEKFLTKAGQKKTLLQQPIFNEDTIRDHLKDLDKLKNHYSSTNSREKTIIISAIISCILSGVVAWNARGATPEIPKNVSTENPQNTSQIAAKQSLDNFKNQ
jgi:hypothetical protein